MKNRFFSFFNKIAFLNNNEERILYLSAFFIRVSFLFFVVFYFGDVGLVMMGDSPDYFVIAQQFVKHHSFLWGGLNDVYETTRLPAYPLFLSLIVVFNIPFFIASITQILLVSAIPVITLRLVRIMGLNTKIGLFAGFLCVIEPTSIVLSVMLLPDIMNAWFFIVAFYYLAKFVKDKKPLNIYISSLIFALMNYIRPVGLFLGFILPIFLLLYTYFNDRESFKFYLKYSFLFIVVYLSVLIPWMIRNHIHYGVFSFASGVERQIYEITAVGVRASVEGVSHQDMLLKMRTEITPLLVEPRDMANFRNNGILFGPALDIIFSNSAQYLKLYFMSLVTFFSSANYHNLLATFEIVDNTMSSVSYSFIYATSGFIEMVKVLFSNISNPHGFILIAGRVVWGLMFTLSLIGFYYASKIKSARFTIFLFLTTCFYMAVVIAHLTVGTEPRHRLFLNPFYFIFTAVALSAIYNRLMNKKDQNQNHVS